LNRDNPTFCSVQILPLAPTGFGFATQLLPTFSTCYLLLALVVKRERDPFNGLFSRTTCVSWYQKGKTILDFNEARDDEVAVAPAGP